ncbi:SAM-dependent methyltransferase [Pseudonocardia aurantiaca]|uniref:SAM-dependent methyltransferase n=1 Tax=Pseudonocardia aurantiaca TaxID=75290 RepID=A0ABW4FVF4_9PSEU
MTGDGPAEGAGRDDRRAADLPPGVDLGRPSIARVYDYFLGGKEHFEIDRMAVAAAYEVIPELSRLAHDNRNHLRRAIRFLVADAGVRQFLDLGSGLPTVGNVHDIARNVDPAVRVVYVDNDPLVLAHGRALLSDDTTTLVLLADVRDTEAIFDGPEIRGFVDFDKPFAVIATSILHQFDDHEAYAVADRIKARLTLGSYVVISNFLDDDEPRANAADRAFLAGGLGTGRFRRWSEQREFFEGLEMVEPGFVYANDWRPDEYTPTDSPVHTLYAAGVARKPV